MILEKKKSYVLNGANHHGNKKRTSCIRSLRKVQSGFVDCQPTVELKKLFINEDCTLSSNVDLYLLLE